MKRISFFSAACLWLLGACLASACHQDHASPDYARDKSGLSAMIDSATTLLQGIQEGNKPGEYAPGSKDTLQAVLNLASQVNGGSTFTQQEVNNTASNLGRVISYVRSKVIQEVSVANLVAQWKFDGDAKDATGHGHDGMPETGLVGASVAEATDGKTLPALTTDRFGRASMAYAFKNGAYIEVPYDLSLNPKQFTISLWLKRENTSAGNYLFSLDRWNGYKFQLQTNNFLFLTVSTDQGIHDVDDNPGTIPQDTWTHAAVSYTDGTMKFYINGALVKTVEVKGSPVTLSPPVNLAIGNELPKSDYNMTNSADPNYFWGANFFTGDLDDIRFYNTALSDAEIFSIYTIEKSL